MDGMENNGNGELIRQLIAQQKQAQKDKFINGKTIIELMAEREGSGVSLKDEFWGALNDRIRHPMGWGTAYETGFVCYVSDAADANKRMGDCPNMKGKLKKNDLLLCTGHSGDWFHNFVVIEQTKTGIKKLDGTEFGAYSAKGIIELTPLNELLRPVPDKKPDAHTPK